MNTREKVLSYCQYCTNRQFDPESGVLCSLTGEKPAFEKSCPDFKKDTQFVLKKGSIQTHYNHSTTRLMEKIKDIFHPNYDPNELQDVSIRLSKVKFMGVFGIVLIAWFFSIYLLFEGEGVNKIEVLNILGSTTLVIITLLLGEVKKIFSSTPLIHISQRGLKLYGEPYDWRDVVSFIIIEEPSSSRFRVVDSYLQFEFIGHIEDTQILIERLNISKHDLVKLLASVQKRYMNPAMKASVS
jgi:hypothetical protein